MGKIILSFVIATLFVVTLVQKGEALDAKYLEDTKKYLVDFVYSLDRSKNKDGLESKDMLELIDMAIVGIKNCDTLNEMKHLGEDSLLWKQIQYFKGLKNQLTGKTLSTTQQRINQDNKPLIHHVESENDFDNQVKNAESKLVVVDFYATWCKPCKYIYPTLAIFAEKYASELVVLKVDVDEQTELTEKYQVTGMPTFVFLKNGEKVEEFTGADREKLENTIKALIN